MQQLRLLIILSDFPTGGTIYGYNGVKEAFETGRGRIVIRAKAEIESHANHEDIIVTEIPYNVNKAELIKYIADLVNEKKIDGIADLNDESDYKGMRIVIRLKSDANANVVLNKLYKLTQMQSSFSVNNVAIVNGRPRTLNLKELLQAFVDHRHEVVIRRTRFELRKAEERAHILEGLIVAEANIDEVIQIIKGADSVEDARAQLAERFNLTEPQTLAIVEMKLRSLAKLEQDKLRQQYDDIERLIAHYNLILSDEHECRELIKSELVDVREKYGDARKTDIDYTAGDFNAEDFYADDDMIITISHLGYIKRTPLSEFRAQARGGVGSRGSNTRDEDFIEHIYPASMHNTMLFFTDRGLVYKMKVYELPEGAKNSKGRALQNLLDIEQGDKVRAYIACKQLDDPEFTGSHFLVFATRKGVVKKTSLAEYARVMAKGKKAIIIREDDSLIGVELTDNDSTILLAAKEGKAIRFATSSLRAMGRVSTGVRGMKVEGENEVIGMITMEPDSTNTVMVISENGYGKRTALDAYTPHNRGGKGMKTINVTDKTGPLVGFLSVNDDNDLIIINQSGITIRIHMSDLRIMGRATQGVRLINLEKRNDTIASVCCVDSDPEEDVDNDVLVAEAEQEEIEFAPDVEEADDDDVADDAEETVEGNDGDE
jgi:DNA gyrase subunit A